MPKKTELYACNNGCKLYPDCFTCPFPDCKIESLQEASESRKRYYQRHKQERLAKSKEYQKGYRARKRLEALQKEFPHLNIGG